MTISKDIAWPVEEIELGKDLEMIPHSEISHEEGLQGDNRELMNIHKRKKVYRMIISSLQIGNTHKLSLAYSKRNRFRILTKWPE